MNSLCLPLHALPPGYTGFLRAPSDPPPTPRPAATLALLRAGSRGIEVLLLKRTPKARFIPGAFVFPGGRVDPSDASPELSSRVRGVVPREVDTALGVARGEPPGTAFLAAALRETFEETGILLSPDAPGGAISSLSHPLAEKLRGGLLAEEISLQEVLEELDIHLQGGGLAFIGHWVTPVQQWHRYDTRFLGAVVSKEVPVSPDGEELVEGVWLSPEEALRRNAQGRLPMVFPTFRTLEDLQEHDDPREALEAMRRKKVQRLLPRLREEEDGVRMTLPQCGAEKE